MAHEPTYPTDFVLNGKRVGPIIDRALRSSVPPRVPFVWALANPAADLEVTWSKTLRLVACVGGRGTYLSRRVPTVARMLRQAAHTERPTRVLAAEPWCIMPDRLLPEAWRLNPYRSGHCPPPLPGAAFLTVYARKFRPPQQHVRLGVLLLAVHTDGTDADHGYAMDALQALAAA